MHPKPKLTKISSATMSGNYLNRFRRHPANSIDCGLEAMLRGQRLNLFPANISLENMENESNTYAAIGLL
jgi:hypothetical protein